MVNLIPFHQRLRRLVMRRMYGPQVEVVPASPLIRIGTAYGGWTLLDGPRLHGSVLVSCGLGEDASFDVQYASRYGAAVRMVDPTPRAIDHFAAIVERIGQPATEAYVPGGRQPVGAYDLSQIAAGQLQLVEVAVSDTEGEARFFEPPNPDDVSHSLINFQNDYASDTRHIVVRTMPMEQAFDGLGAARTVLKLDIEGAEGIALQRLSVTDVRPDQILVEYDELSRPSRRARAAFDRGHTMLQSIGYRPVHFDGRTCVSYVRADVLAGAPRPDQGS